MCCCAGAVLVSLLKTPTCLQCKLTSAYKTVTGRAICVHWQRHPYLNPSAHGTAPGYLSGYALLGVHASTLRPSVLYSGWCAQTGSSAVMLNMCTHIHICAASPLLCTHSRKLLDTKQSGHTNRLPLSCMDMGPCLAAPCSTVESCHLHSQQGLLTCRRCLNL